MSYYQTIAGKRYDRKLLKEAESLTEGRGDGRISLDDAASLWNKAQDGRGLTTVEKDTLIYVLENFRVTDKAKDWLSQQISFSPLDELREDLENLKMELEVPGLEIRFDPKVLAEMNRRFPSEETFYEAIEKAIQTILFDSSDRNSPLAVLMDIRELYPDMVEDEEAFFEELRIDLRQRMNEGFLFHVPIWEEAPGDGIDVYAPDNRESSSKYWIFYLGIVTDDHQFWTIVDRQGVQQPYNYGYN